MPTKKTTTKCRHQLGICFCCCSDYFSYLCGFFVCYCVVVFASASCDVYNVLIGLAIYCDFVEFKPNICQKTREVRLNSCNLNVQCVQGNNSQCNGFCFCFLVCGFFFVCVFVFVFCFTTKHVQVDCQIRNDCICIQSYPYAQ